MRSFTVLVGTCHDEACSLGFAASSFSAKLLSRVFMGLSGQCPWWPNLKAYLAYLSKGYATLLP